MKIVQIATAVEHYKNGEIYTDLYGIDESGNPYIWVYPEWILLGRMGNEGPRGDKKIKLGIQKLTSNQISLSKEVVNSIFGATSGEDERIKRVEHLCAVYFNKGLESAEKYASR